MVVKNRDVASGHGLAGVVTVDSVWDAIKSTPAKAGVMRVRSDLLTAIRDHIKKQGYFQKHVSERCGITQARVSHLMNGKISEFSTESLMEIAINLGLNINLTFTR